MFQPGGRVTGSDGSNKLSGTYELNGDAITLGRMIGTQMACVNAAAEIERAFRAALKTTTRWRMSGSRLELLDTAGKVQAAFQGGPEMTPAASAKLVGTTWQLVKFQGGGGKTKDSHLFLSLMADGGIYEFEAIPGAKVSR